MAQRISNPAIHHIDKDTGAPLSGGQLFFFEIDSTTPKDTFSDEEANIPNTNPVILDASGVEPDIFGVGSYRIVLQNSNDVQQWERDPVNFEISGAQWSDWLATINYAVNDVVEASDGNYFSSIQTPNLNNDPLLSPTFWTQTDLVKRWNINEVYDVRDVTTASDFTLYLSQVSNNLGNDPISSPTEWLPSGAGSGGSFAFSGWDSSIDYGVGGTSLVTGSNGKYYKSIQTPNLNNDPVIPSPLFWQESTFVEEGNITVQGDTIASTVLNSDINISPDGTGVVAITDLTATDITATGTVVLPTTTSIGSVSSTEIGFVDGVTSAIQTQINTKAGIADNENISGTWEWQDNVKLRLGNSADIELDYDSAANSFDIALSTGADFRLLDDTVVKMQFDNSANQFDFSTEIRMADSQAIEFGAGDDLSIFSDGTNAVFNLLTGADLSLQDAGVTKITYDNSQQRLDFTAASMRINDGNDLLFGSGSDIQISYETDTNALEIDLSTSADVLLMDNQVIKYQFDNSANEHIFTKNLTINDPDTVSPVSRLELKSDEGTFVLDNEFGQGRISIADPDGSNRDTMINFPGTGTGGSRDQSVELNYVNNGVPDTKLETINAGGFLTGTWSGNCPSDLRLKKNVKPVAGLPIIRLIDGITWDWIDPVNANQEQELYGFSAQSYRLAYPSQVIEVDGFLRIEHKVSSQRLNADLVEAVKQLDDIVTAQQAAIDDLLDRVEGLGG